jgi:UDP-glucose 4-epimerase
MRVFVTGGAGFIGSHPCVALLNAGHEGTSFDNFSNGSPEALVRASEITGKAVLDVLAVVTRSTSVRSSSLQTAEQ